MAGMGPKKGQRERPMDHHNMSGLPSGGNSADPGQFGSGAAGTPTVRGAMKPQGQGGKVNQSGAKGLGVKGAGKSASTGKGVKPAKSTGTNFNAEHLDMNSHAGGHGAGSACPDVWSGGGRDRGE